MGDIKFTGAIKQIGIINKYNDLANLVNKPLPAPRRTLNSKPFEKDNENYQRGV